MALTVSNAVLDNPGGVRFAYATVTFDNSYATGGYAVTPATFGLSEIFDVFPAQAASDASLVKYVASTGKLKVLRPAQTQSKVRSLAKSAVNIAATNPITLTGLAATDVVLSALKIASTNSATTDATADVTATGTNSITFGTVTFGATDNLYVLVARPGDFTSAVPAEVANATDLSAVSVPLLVVGTKF